MQIDKDELLTTAAKLGISKISAEELWNTLTAKKQRSFPLRTVARALLLWRHDRYYCDGLVCL